MTMIDQKANAQKSKKRKLFDDSNSEQSDSDQEDAEKQVKQINKGGKSNVVKRMIYNEKDKPIVNKKETKDQIPEEIEQIMNDRAKQHNDIVNKYKKEYFSTTLKLEKEYSETLNEYNRNERLHKKNMEELKEAIDKKIEAERNKFVKEKRVFERQNKAMQNLPNRREREEIDALIKHLKQIEDDLKKKEQRNKLTIERLRKQVNESRDRNDELIEERENVFKAVKGMSYNDEENKNEVMHDVEQEE